MSFPFGDNVRKFRENLGLSQEELAKRSRLSKDHVSKIERGEKCNPALMTMESLAKALNTSLVNLISAKSGKPVKNKTHHITK